MTLAATYVLPIRRARHDSTDELTEYLEWLTTEVREVIVVDGSAAPVFEAHHARWAHCVAHVPPDPVPRCLNGKVQGVHSGLARASFDAVVIADDDVRYDEQTLRRVVDALGSADLSWPQNYFDPLPWHARWDTARTLLNRATGCDFPGTVAIRRTTFARLGGYDGDVLWENLELLRTVQAAGATVAFMADCFVRRRPPTASHFWSQRVRQAYDEFARPARLGAALAVLPAALLGGRRHRRVIAGFVVATAAWAEIGRRRDHGTTVFPPSSSLLAPIWILERAVTAWLALASRLANGGIRYHGETLRAAATPRRRLRTRFVDELGAPAFRSSGIGVRPPVTHQSSTAGVP